MSKRGAQSDSERGAVRPGDPIQPDVADLGRLVSELEAGLDQLVASILGPLRASLPSWMVENVFVWEEISVFAAASVRTQLDGFRRGVLPDRCPPVDAAGAEAIAKVGQLKSLLGGYRVCQMTLWETWLDLVEGSVKDLQDRHDLLRYGSEYFFLYVGLVSDYVADIYQAEFERAARSGAQRRFHAIRRLLEGDPSLVDAQVDIDLERYHLGFVAWGEGGELLARDLATSLTRPMLSIAVLNQNWWGWLSSSRPLSTGQERELKRLQVSPEGGIAFGLEAFGESGFRATNRQALRGRWVARRTGRSYVTFADIAIEALAGANQEDALAFVGNELRGIEDDSTGSQRIRETIIAYFAADHNAASAAAALGVHQQTVANRLRAAEERLGQPVGVRRVEIETALRLRAVLSRPHR